MVFYTYDGNWWNGFTQATWRAANTWYDSDTGGQGVHETALGEVAAFTMLKRARIQIATAPIPTDPNPLNRDDASAIRVYVSQGGTARTDFYRQAAPADGVTSVLLPKVVFSNADTLHPNPPALGNFPSGVAGVIRSDDGEHYFDGEGVLSASQVLVDGVDLAASDWTPLTLASPWGNASGYGVASYRRVGKEVRLRGVVTPSSNTSNATITTLPATHRPLTSELCPAAVYTTPAQTSIPNPGIQVTSAGAVIALMGANAGAAVSLNGVRFFID